METTLALDCSFAGLHMAVQTAGGKVHSFVDTTPRSSDTLHLQLVQLAEKSALQLDSLQHMVVTVGPGSFTGVRIGLAVAQALKLVNPQLKLTGISTLQALAQNVVEEHQPQHPFTIILSAAGADVYSQSFSAQGMATSAITCQTQQQALQGMPPHTLLVAQSSLLLPVQPAISISQLKPQVLLAMAANPACHQPLQPVYVKELTYRHATAV